VRNPNETVGANASPMPIALSGYIR